MPFSDEELLKPVETIINKVRPMLVADGGDVTLLKIQEGKVYVRLEGACKGCSSSSKTLKFGIERALKDEIHPDIEIINVA
ncbi:MAG: NifU family protein [Helicobacter sp.]|nr:NifU family protein [Helicobacter sp.]